MDHGDEFVRRMTEREGYIARFLVTLEVNKIEAAHQKPDEPMIFRKRVDELGIIEWFEMNPRYHGRVPKPRTEFSFEEGQAFARSLSPKSMMALHVAFMIGELEHLLLSGYLAKDRDCTPLLRKTCDGQGIPTGYQLNRPDSEFSAMLLTVAAYEAGHQA